ncbi:MULTISPECIES: WXG100-like domain-containing protein [Streptomyces]|uniref:WXG100 family type VII secretion target n=1 Tax=Streptomyces decoyicus TaxID=249567 RepID=A0ABZ1FGR2_9ACTN|nr:MULTISPECIES: WXG100 family type VII secretion target [Streptomyces]MCL7494074.1 WXG100 family type VII secretion target [Streptomyces sp. MCA2]WSB69366.1 WXG100 family type VII secretion target [Streptomyces decoyicus]
MSGPVSGALGAYNKVNDWMSGFDSAVDSIMRPLVEPLAEHLEAVTGDDEGIQEAAKLWRDQAAELRDLIADQRRDRADLAHEWTGEAAEAFQGHLAELETALEAEAEDMDAVADVLEQAGAQAKMAEQVVETLIRELIEWALIELAVALATSIVTAGISAAAAAAAAVAEASFVSARIARVLAELAKELKAFVNIIKLLKKAKKMSKVKKLKPWTWKHLKDPVEAEKFAKALAAKKALKVIKTPMKGAVELGMGGLGFSGDPTQAVSPIVQHEADELDDALSGKGSHDSGGSGGHGSPHLPPASDFEAQPVAQDPLSRYREPAVSGHQNPPVTGLPTDPAPVAQDPLSRYREPAVEENPGVTTMPAAARTTAPRDPDNPFG